MTILVWTLLDQSQINQCWDGDSSYHIASCLAGTFSVITTLDVNVQCKNNLLKRGFDRICVNVSSVRIPVLELDNEDSNAALSIERNEKSINYYKSEAIILGCAGMADFAEKLEEKFSIPVVEGVSSSIVLAEV